MSVTLVVRARVQQQPNPWIRGQYVVDDPWVLQALTALLRQRCRELAGPGAASAPQAVLDAHLHAILQAPFHASAIQVLRLDVEYRVIIVRNDLRGAHLSMTNAQIITKVDTWSKSGRLAA